MKKTVAAIYFIAFVSPIFGSGEFIINSTTFFKPVKNSMTSIANGDTIVYDDPANPNGTFSAVFHIRFKLDENEVREPCKIIVYAQKNSDSPNWRKIAEVIPGQKPATGDWDVSFFWDSTKASYDWTGTPFKENLKIRLKLVSN